MVVSYLLTASLAPSLAITHVSVIPMDREVVLVDQTVVTNGRYIAAIGPTGKIQVPSGATLINGKGKFLIPGLIDMDVQLLSPIELPLYLANGVTTVFNHKGRPSILAWRNRIRKGELTGPTIFSCGPKILRSKDVKEASQIATDQAKAGYDSIFVDVGVNGPSYAAMTSTAKKSHLLAFGKIPRSVGLAGVLQAKVPIVLTEEFFNGYLYTFQDKRTGMRNAAKLTSDARVPVIPSLVTTTHRIRQAEDLPGFLKRIETQFLSPWQRESWQLGFNEIQTRFGDKRFHAGLVENLENEREMVRQLHSAKAPVLVGTNANFTGVVPGFSEVEEIKNLQRLGFSNVQALKSATVDSALALNQSNRLGSIAKGMQADMVLLDGNPLTNLDNLEKRSGVISQGKWFSMATLQKNLAGIPKQYDAVYAKGLAAMKGGANSFLVFQEENDPQQLMMRPLMLQLLKSGNDSAYASFVDQMATRDPRNPAFNENGLNNFGYLLLNTMKQSGLAVKVFTVNMRRHPKSPNMYDSLAEGYLKLGNKAKAIEYYRQALRVDPTFRSSADALARLGASR
jgi:hypothetical protein